MKDYNNCPECSGELESVGSLDVCTNCGWKAANILYIPREILSAEAGKIFQGRFGVYERTEYNDWRELGTGIVYTNDELIKAEGRWMCHVHPGDS